MSYSYADEEFFLFSFVLRSVTYQEAVSHTDGFDVLIMRGTSCTSLLYIRIKPIIITS